jgi:hypothetical protein
VQPETLPKNIPVYKISSLKITPPKTPNSGQFSYPLPNIVSFLFEKKSMSSGLGHMIFLLIYFRFGSHIVKDFEVP